MSFLPPANEVYEGNVFTGVCLSTGGGVSIQGGSLTRGSLYRGVSVQGGSLSRGSLSKGGLYPGGLCPRGCLSIGVSVQGGLCLIGSLSRGGLLSGRPPPLSGKERAIRILLECILVSTCFFFK